MIHKHAFFKVWLRGSTGPYKFAEVPQDIYDGLRQAASAEQYFDAHIRDQYSVS